MSEVTGVLAVLLVGVEHEAVWTEGPPTVPVLTCPVFVALVRVGEVEVFLCQLGVGRASETERHFIVISTRDRAPGKQTFPHFRDNWHIL